MKNRNIKMDILKIVAMFMVITHHIVISGFGLQNNIVYESNTLRLKQFILLIIINAFVIHGVNIFFLISGYFKINFNKEKLISYLLKIYVIYDIVTLIGVKFNYVSLDSATIKNLINPVSVYWFLTVYLFLMIISPYINKMLEYFTKENYKKNIIIIISLFSLYGFFFDVNVGINGGYSLIWAIFMYIIGNLVNKYEIKNKKGLLLYFVFSIINSLLIIYLCLNNKSPDAWQYYRYNFILVFLGSYYLFTWFNYIKININSDKLKKVVLFFSTSTMIVYMLHSTCWLTILRNYPIEYMFNHDNFRIAIILLPIYVFVIYFNCSTVAFIYSKLFRR